MRTLACAALALALLCTATAGSAATRELSPGQSFEQAVESLQPGDTLIVHAGDYFDNAGRIAITVQGTPTLPVLITGAPGEARPHIRRAGSRVENTINLDGARYVTITGLEISSNGGDGVNLNSNPAFITLENLEIHDVDVGVNFRSSMNDIVVRRNHVYRTGDGGTGTGEGMYVGCHEGDCAVSNSLIENNWIHDTANSTQGDGIEVKLGSYNVTVRDNVIYNTGYPCIILYGTQGNPVNRVEGNVMWSCGDSGIQAAADAIIRNNIILGNSGATTFNSQTHEAAVPQNLQFVHNTLIGGAPCLRLNSWSGRPGLVLANNAIVCEGGGYVIGGLSGVTVRGNVIYPQTSALPGTGYTVGRAPGLDFLDAAARNVYPTATSTVIDAGDAAHGATVDFNGTARQGAPDAGAYEWTTATNPGWAVVPGFKNVTSAPPAPTVTLSANPTTVAMQGSSTLTWSSTNAASCTASGGWSGTKATSGSQSVGPLTATATYTLTCTASGGGSASRSVTVTVNNPTPAPTVFFSATPSTLTAGSRSTLTWSSTNATGCVASGAWAGNKASSGSEQSPVLNSTSTFTLRCDGAGGSASQSVTVTVNAAPPPPPPPPPAPTVALTASATSVAVNATVTLSWTSTNATGCTASGGWSGAKGTSGSETVGPLTNTATYTLQCTGAGGNASDSETVTVTAGGGGGGGGSSGGSGGGGLDRWLLALLGLLALLNIGSGSGVTGRRRPLSA